MFTATRVAAGVAIVALGGSLAIASVWQAADNPVLTPAAVTEDPATELDGVHVSGLVGFKLYDPVPDMGVTTEQPDGSEIYRDAWFETVWTSDDPRFSGTGEYTSNSNTYPTAMTEDVTVGWGTQSLTTEEGGTWTARAETFGLILGDESLIPIWFDGSGAYEGLSAMLIQQVEQLDNGQYRFNFDGWVVPGDAHFEDARE